MEWYLKVMREFANFSGRARRKEYWMFVLFNFIFSAIAAVLDKMLGFSFNEQLPYGYIYVLYSLVVLVPSLAVLVRRLHDVDKSGWWFLIAFIPILGGIYLLILMCTDGKPGSNKWGQNPKENFNEINEIGVQ